MPLLALSFSTSVQSHILFSMNPSCPILQLLSVAVSCCSAQGQVPTSCNPSNNSCVLLQTCMFFFPDNYQQSASPWPLLRYTEYSYKGSASLDLINLFKKKSFHLISLHLGMRHGHRSYSLRQKQRQEENSLVMKCCLPVFFRCMRLGCNRFPQSCSGTPATSVCCFSPGLGSFLRPRSAASWAPRIGRRTETGTYFIHTSPLQNEPGERESRRLDKTGRLRVKISALLEV